MEALQAEQSNLEKKGNLCKTIEDVQRTIDLLIGAREAVAADGSSAAATLAKLKSPIKQSFDKANDDMKTVYSALNKYSKAIDKKFKPIALPSAKDPLSSHPTLTNRAIAMHLLREGQFDVAATFIAEANTKPPRPDANEDPSQTGNSREHDQDHAMDQDEDIAMPLTSWDQEFIATVSELGPVDARYYSAKTLETMFTLMYCVLDALRNDRNLEPAINWARQYSSTLEKRGSNLEFELCRLRFVELYCGHGHGHGHGHSGGGGRDDDDDDDDDLMSDGHRYDDRFGPLRALEYARNTFPNFSSRYMRETSALLGSLAYSPGLTTSPYRHVFFNERAWDDVASSFVREFCGMLGLSERSPLYTAVTAGGIALPVLEKLERVMGEVGGQWTSVNELPVEIPLPPSYLFHSIFVCPVSKEQATDANPPMMLPCGHVIAKESLEKISRGNK
ncbi:hypothetical protein MBLNU459_g2297t2 [Dothideomycetes sp. NU459]